MLPCLDAHGLGCFNELTLQRGVELMPTRCKVQRKRSSSWQRKVNPKEKPQPDVTSFWRRELSIGTNGVTTRRKLQRITTVYSCWSSFSVSRVLLVLVWVMWDLCAFLKWTTHKFSATAPLFRFITLYGRTCAVSPNRKLYQLYFHEWKHAIVWAYVHQWIVSNYKKFGSFLFLMHWAPLWFCRVKKGWKSLCVSWTDVAYRKTEAIRQTRRRNAHPLTNVAAPVNKELPGGNNSRLQYDIVQQRLHWPSISSHIWISVSGLTWRAWGLFVLLQKMEKVWQATNEKNMAPGIS